MQAQRKLADPAPITLLEDVAPVDGVMAPEREMRQPSHDDLPTSPAILLQEQLAARLAQTEATTVEAQGAGDAGETKWPMPLRIVAIVGLSLALWGCIFLTTVMLLT